MHSCRHQLHLAALHAHCTKYVALCCTCIIVTPFANFRSSMWHPNWQMRVPGELSSSTLTQLQPQDTAAEPRDCLHSRTLRIELATLCSACSRTASESADSDIGTLVGEEAATGRCAERVDDFPIPHAILSERFAVVASRQPTIRWKGEHSYLR